MVSVTERAAEKIAASLRSRGRGIGIRLGIKTTGCSGLAYVLEFVDSLNDDDNLIHSQGVQVIVNNKSKPIVEGLTIDYVKRGLNEGFEFVNPNEVARCGCGESFTVK